MPKTALDLARALVRYNRMPPDKAYFALFDEWPPAVAKLVEKVLWSEVKMRSERQIVRDLRALQEKARRANATVQRAKARPRR